MFLHAFCHLSFFSKIAGFHEWWSHGQAIIYDINLIRKNSPNATLTSNWLWISCTSRFCSMENTRHLSKCDRLKQAISLLTFLNVEFLTCFRKMIFCGINLCLYHLTKNVGLHTCQDSTAVQRYDPHPSSLHQLSEVWDSIHVKIQQLSRDITFSLISPPIVKNVGLARNVGSNTFKWTNERQLYCSNKKIKEKKDSKSKIDWNSWLTRELSAFSVYVHKISLKT